MATIMNEYEYIDFQSLQHDQLQVMIRDIATKIQKKLKSHFVQPYQVELYLNARFTPNDWLIINRPKIVRIVGLSQEPAKLECELEHCQTTHSLLLEQIPKEVADRFFADNIEQVRTHFSHWNNKTQAKLIEYLNGNGFGYLGADLGMLMKS